MQGIGGAQGQRPGGPPTIVCREGVDCHLSHSSQLNKVFVCRSRSLVGFSGSVSNSLAVRALSRWFEQGEAWLDTGTQLLDPVLGLVGGVVSGRF